jgi:membrane peptidoglycan carboxypeptidase
VTDDEPSLLARWRARRARKKARIRAMSPGKRIARRVGILGTWLLSGVALLMVALVVAFYTLTDVPRPSDLPLPQVATILYSDGSVLARIGDQDRTIVSLDQVPAAVRYDVIAAEDRSFYSEPGVSIKGTVRAAFTDLTGGDTQGGSTITQQYVKNAYLSDSRTLSRKLQELLIAVKLDRQYTKDQILEYYLNTVYFGRGAYGIEAAAQAFFGTSVSKLNVAQGAVLAALLRAPSYYDPAGNPVAAKARWQYVIDGMVSIKQLTQQQAATLTYPTVLPPKKTNGLGAVGNTALIVHRVLVELEANGISQDDIYKRGLQIKTTINSRAQAAALSAISTTFSGLTAAQKNMKNSLVAIDPTSGGVLAYYGGSGPGVKNYAGQYDSNDYGYVGTRPPGSSFKPYTLATVLSQTLAAAPGTPKLTIASRVDGSFCVTVAGTRICNDPSDAGVSGPSVTIANAMKYSLNTTFDQLAYQAGPSNVAKTAHAMGVRTTDAYGNPLLADKAGTTSFGIGIGDYPVSPIDQAVGFATFASGGIRHEAFFVAQATDSNGNVVYRHQIAGERAIDGKVANDVTLTLKPVAAYSGDPLTGGRVSGAKTGTEGISGTTNNSDAWMVGFTPQVSAAVWVGSGNSTVPIVNAAGRPEYGADLPGKTWALFMDTYLAGQPMLPMATKQLITGGQNESTPTPTPRSSASSSSSSASRSATTSAPPSSATTSPSSPTVSRTHTTHTPRPTCTSGVPNTCPPPGG